MLMVVDVAVCGISPELEKGVTVGYLASAAEVRGQQQQAKERQAPEQTYRELNGVVAN